MAEQTSHASDRPDRRVRPELAEPGSRGPGVVVFATVRDEERDLARAVSAVLAQDYAGPFVFALAVGPSHDATAQIAADLAAADPRVVVVENPTGLTPQGLNLAWRAGVAALPGATYLVRTDGHAELPQGYVATAVEVLERTGADNVGGMMMPEGSGAVQEAVACAMGHPVGLGGGTFHVGGGEGPAETVYLGSFRRTTLESLDGFDEHWSRAQDWELNLRLRAAGHTVWFTPAMQVAYRPRASLGALRRQFHLTGRWRREMVRLHPETASVRYLAPPTVTVAVLLGLVLGVVGLLTPATWLTLGLLAPGLYAAGVLVAALVAGRGLPVRALAVLPVVLAVMHLSWGSGFLRGLPRSRRA